MSWIRLLFTSSIGLAAIGCVLLLACALYVLFTVAKDIGSRREMSEHRRERLKDIV